MPKRKNKLPFPGEKWYKTGKAFEGDEVEIHTIFTDEQTRHKSEPTVKVGFTLYNKKENFFGDYELRLQDFLKVFVPRKK